MIYFYESKVIFYRDGNSTFNLPNPVDRVLQGTGTRGAVGTTLNESLPNINGNFYALDYSGATGQTSSTYGALNVNSRGTGSTTGTVKDVANIGFDASRSSSTYQDDAPVQQDALCIAYIIKF